MRAEFIENKMATPSVCTPRLRPEKMFEFKPGQYIMVSIKKDSWILRKPYSIASTQDKDYIELCIKIVPNGFVSNFMASAKKGDSLEIAGPYGIFVLREPVKNDVIFAATGTGISALKPMIDTVFKKGTDKNVWLFFGVRTEDEIIYRKEFDNLAKKHKNFGFIPVLSQAGPGWKGEKGHVQDAVKKYIKDPKGKEIYLCGVLAMVEEMIKMVQEMGFDKDKIYYEEYV